MYLSWTKCCGVWEIDGLRGYDNPLVAFLELGKILNRHYQRPGFIIFTGVTENNEAEANRVNHAGSRRTDNYGLAFADFIKEHGFGSIVAPKPVVNPLSDNKICIWTWTPDWKQMGAYYVKEGVWQKR